MDLSTVQRIFILSIFLVCSFGLKAQKKIENIKVDAKFYQADLSDVLVDISRQSGINISFDPAVVSQQKLVSIQVEKVLLLDLLDVLLTDTSMEYKVLGNQIVLLEKPEKPLALKKTMRQIYGYVQDSKTKERLPYANIYSVDKVFSSYTNAYGYFYLEMSSTSDSTAVQYIGYKTNIVSLNDRDSLVLYIDMVNKNQLKEIVITETNLEKGLQQFDSYSTVELEKMRRTRKFAGEADILREIQMKPGVTTGADGLGGYSVRGGNNGNNLVLLDGIPVYNVSHALGVLSVFDEFSIKSSKFFRSHMPAQYGGRLSSILDIRTKEGSLKKFGGAVGVGLITAHANLEGPILKDKVSFTLSARRTILDPYIKPVSETLKKSKGITGYNDYAFSDVNSKLQFVINDKNRIYLSYYGGHDAFYDTSESSQTDGNTVGNYFSEYNWAWSNNLFSTRWSSQFGKKSFSNLSLYASGYDFQARNVNQDRVNSEEGANFYELSGSQINTRIFDIGLLWNMDFYANGNNRVNYGLQLVNHRFQPSLVTYSTMNQDFSINMLSEKMEELADVVSRQSSEIEGYIENEYTDENFKINYGLRLSSIFTSNKTYWNLQPRVGLKAKMTDKLFGKISINSTSQYLHLITSNGIGIPTDIWIPSSDEIRPESAYQLSSGIEYLIFDLLDINIEGFYRWYRNVLNLKEGALFSVIDNTDWETNIPVGTGRAFGLENAVKAKIRNHHAEVNYTWSKSLRNFADINSGKSFYSRFDRRHQLNAHYQWIINSNFSFSSSYTFATGNPQTLPTLILDNEFIYTEKHNQRLPSYSRLDMAFEISNDFKWGKQHITLGVFNVLNKQNPYYYFIENNPLSTQKFNIKQVTIFPILPNLSYTLHF